MKAIHFLTEAVKDYRSLGASFAAVGLKRRMTRQLLPVSVAGHQLWVRGGDSDFHTLRQTLRDREYAISPRVFEQQAMARYEAILQQGRTPVIIDAGANIGGASIWFSQQYPKAVVLAVEPDPGNIAVLRRNVTDCPNIVVVDAAIGSEAGFVALDDRGAGWATQTQRASSGIAIVTVPDLLAQVDQGELFQAKIDIEGFEKDLFARNTDWLAGVEVVYVEPHEWMSPGQGTSLSFQKAIACHDFALLMRGENLIYVANRAN